MGFLRGLFGPSREEIWRQLCDQIQGEYVAGGFWKEGKVLIRHGQWTITLDAFTRPGGEQSHAYTRLRAPYLNADGFRFTIYRRGFFSGLGKLLGMHDVEIGHSEFDEAFIIQGNDEAKLKGLFANEQIRRLIEMQPSIYLTVKDNEGWFGPKFPEGVDELHFEALGIIKDLGQLKSLYYLFAETLNHLCNMGSACEDNPNLPL